MLLRKFIAYCISFIVFAFFAAPAFAQSPTLPALPTSNLQHQHPASNIQLPTSISPTSPLYTDLLVNNLFHSFSCLAIGQSVIGQPCLTYQMTRNAQGMIQGIPVLSQTNLSGGALGATTSIIGALYQNPPVRTTDYLASVGHGLGIVKEAHAQVVGSGSNILNPILKLWQTSRNISYLLTSLIFLVIGLMIMFRNKINPQTVISAQAALPGLIIGLIMITFSYFFAGLVSDVAFIGTNIVGYYFQVAQEIKTPQNLVERTQQQNVLSIFSKFVGVVTKDDATNAIDSIFNSFSGEVQNYLRIFVGIIAFQFSSQIGGAVPVYGSIVGPILGLISATTIQAGISPILGFIVSLVAVAILIFAMLKLLLRLINNYLTIIFLTITAPFQFLFASLPGRQGIATGWMLSMLANILAFPAVMAVFYFVNYLLGSIAVPNSPFAVGSTPALIDTTSFPLFGGMNISFIRIVAAFGALVATPTIPDLIARGLGRFSQAGQLIGQEITGGIRSGQGYTTQTAQKGFGAVQSMGTGIGGQTQWGIDPRTGFPTRIVNQPGLWRVIRDPRFR